MKTLFSDIGFQGSYDFTTESIAHQKRSRVAGLEKAIQAEYVRYVKMPRDKSKDIDDFPKLSKIMSNLFNMNITVANETTRGAWCMTPRLRQRTPLNPANGVVPGNVKLNFLIDPYLAVEDGMIDTLNAKVGGAFSKVPVVIGISFSWCANLRLEARHITALLLHEVGHAFNSFMCISKLSIGNMVMQNIIEADNKGHGLEKVSFAANEAEYRAVVAEAKHIPDALTRVKLVTAYGVSHIHRTNFYDSANSENLADAFSAKFGYAKEMVEYMAIGYHDGEPVEDDSILTPILPSTANYQVALGEFMSIGTTHDVEVAKLQGAVAYAFDIRGSRKYTYEDDRHSTKRSIRGMINRLRNMSLSKKDKKSLIEDYDSVMELYVKLPRSRQYLIDSVKEMYSLSVASAIAIKRFQDTIEELADNELFLESTRLKLR